MADFPTVIDYQLPVTTPANINSLGVGMAVSKTAIIANATYPTANLAFFYPFRVAIPYTVVKMFWSNGTVVGNNHVDVGIYDAQGNRLVSAGSTLTAGASAVQIVDTTDTTLQAGLYYMAFACDGTTDNMGEQTLTGNLPNSEILGAKIMTSAFPLPSTATFASPTSVRVYVMGLTSNTTI